MPVRARFDWQKWPNFCNPYRAFTVLWMIFWMNCLPAAHRLTVEQLPCAELFRRKERAPVIVYKSHMPTQWNSLPRPAHRRCKTRPVLCILRIMAGRQLAVLYEQVVWAELFWKATRANHWNYFRLIMFCTRRRIRSTSQLEDCRLARDVRHARPPARPSHLHHLARYVGLTGREGDQSLAIVDSSRRYVTVRYVTVCVSERDIMPSILHCQSAQCMRLPMGGLGFRSSTNLKRGWSVFEKSIFFLNGYCTVMLRSVH